MVFTPNTIFRVCKGVPLDNKYNDTINFANTVEQTLFFYSKTKKEFTDFTYQRINDTVRVPIEADAIYDCNYVMFANSNYGQKWFYGFIESITYVNKTTTEIKYTIDVLQTWMFEYTIKPSFVEREHVTDDGLFKNLVPENLEYGESILIDENFYDWGSLVIVLAYIPMDTTQSGGEIRDGVYTGVKYLWYAISEVDALNTLIQSFANAGQLSAIISIFMIPFAFTLTDTPTGVTLHHEFASIDGYVPKNNKLFNFPYNFLAVNNCEGNEQQYLYEYFADPYTNHFTISYSYNLAATANCHPDNYKGWATNWDEGLVQVNFPVCSWDGNIYANWLALHKMSISQNYLNSLSAPVQGAIGGFVAGGIPGAELGAAIGAFSSVSQITGQMSEVNQKSLVPTQLQGQAKCSVANVKWGRVGFQFKNYGIKAQFAKRIDDYFTMYGYKVNAVKVPNVTGRKAWNFVKTIDVNIVGSIPVEHMVQIKNAFDRGITFWHGDWVGDYTKDNTLGNSNSTYASYFESAETLTTGWGVIFKCNKLMQTEGSGTYNFLLKANGVPVALSAIALEPNDNSKYNVAILTKPISAGDVVTLSYIGSDITAQDGTKLAIFNDEPVINRSTYGDVLFTSAETSINGWIISLKCSKAMLPITGTNYKFTIKVNGEVVQTSSISLNATDNTKYDIGLLVNPILSTDVVSISYSGYDVHATDTSMLKAFTDKLVTNKSTVGPAKIVSASTTINGWVINVKCNKPLKPISSNTGFTVKLNGRTVPIASVKINTADNASIDIMLSISAVIKNDIVSVSYVGKTVVATDGGLLKEFTEFIADNISTVTTTHFVTAYTSVNGWVVSVKCDKIMKSVSSANFIVKLNGKSVGISSIAINAYDKTIYDLTLLERQVIAGQEVTVSYSGTDAIAADNSILMPFENESVTNNSTIVCAEFVSATSSANGWVVTFKCSKMMKPPTNSPYKFTVQINGVSVGVSWIIINANDNTKYDLGLATKAASNTDIITVSYGGWDLVSLDNTALLPFTNMPVTNAVV